MPACPRCGSALIAGTACEFCARYGGPAPEAPQPWQQQWNAPAYQPPMPYGSPPGPGASVDTGIGVLELGWASTRVSWAAILIGLIGALSIGAYWVILNHPDVIGGLLLGFLLDPNKVSQDNQTSIDLAHMIVWFVLSWLPFSFITVHAAQLLLHPSTTSMSSLSQATDVIAPLLWQGVVYIGLALLVWRRSIIALVAACLLFLADSGIYTFAIFKLFQFLWDQYNKYNDFMNAYPGVASENPFDFSKWPWELALPVLFRLAIFWFLVMTFSSLGVVRLHRARLKAAKREAELQAAA